jgi:hypothetical protein
MSAYTIEAVDGFLLGDGNISTNETDLIKSGRFQCGVQYREFCEYLMHPFGAYQSVVKEYPDKNMASGIKFCGRSKFHPDLYLQYQRWYKDGKKQPPSDVRITPTSVMMWYLGDGSAVVDNEKHTVSVRLSTDGFEPDGVEFLAQRLKDVAGISCHRNSDNRIQVEARGISKFFDFIGRNSPVDCYAYKFELPAWRFEAKRMREVADELGIKYDQLSYWVKSGKVPCYRATPNGKPRFLQEHICAIKDLRK